MARPAARFMAREPGSVMVVDFELEGHVLRRA